MLDVWIRGVIIMLPVLAHECELDQQLENLDFRDSDLASQLKLRAPNDERLQCPCVCVEDLLARHQLLKDAMPAPIFFVFHDLLAGVTVVS